jgi:hypothetical protein
MSNDRLREMREHVGVDPDEVLRHPERYSRSDRRLAARVVRERNVSDVRRKP